MFYRNRKATAETLEKLRFDLCCYMSPNFCDCKYGYEPHRPAQLKAAREAAEKGKSLEFQYPYHGEQTGCPELRSVISLLNLLTDEEFDSIMHRNPNIRVD